MKNPNNRTRVISTKVSKFLEESVKQIAKETNTTKSDVVNNALNLYIKTKKEQTIVHS
jgi:predicted transcriptional regulator